MKDALKTWLGPVLGTAIVVSVATAFIASGFAYAGEQGGRGADDVRVVETDAAPMQRVEINALVDKLATQGYHDVDEIE